jgi:Xaa-Pro aminopeptidase
MPPPRGFERSEFDNRLANIQARMLANEIDALLLTEEHDIRYVTGFMTPFWQSPTRPWFVVIPKSGLPVAVIPSIGREAMSRGYTAEILCWPAPQEKDDGISLLAETIRNIAGTEAVIGMMMGSGTKLMMPLMDVETLTEAIGTPQLVDATAIMQGVRMVKSPAEIAKIQHICSLTSNILNNLSAWVAEGMTIREIFAIFKIKTLQAGADDIPYLVGNTGKGGYDDIISPSGSAQIDLGDVLMLDTGSVWDGYFCDFDRNYGLGEVTAEALDTYELLWQATEDALENLKPGMTSAELFGIMQKRIGGSDEAVGRYGHGLGSQLTEPPSHIGWDETTLTENMVLTLEPSMTLSGGKMMVHEENILLTREGAQLLTTRAAPKMPII